MVKPFSGTAKQGNSSDRSTNKEGLLVIISAPSGAGKTSLCEAVMGFFPDLNYSVSHTTRTPRPGETNGDDYHFVSQETFQEMIKDGRFAEWAEVHGNKYGTAAEPIRECLHKEKGVILDIDGQGARQLKDKFPDAVSIFILPPSWEELEERLRSRRTDDDKDIEIRLKNAREEIQYVEQYDYVVINDDFTEAASTLKSIVIAEKCRTQRFLRREQDYMRILEGLAGTRLSQCE